MLRLSEPFLDWLVARIPDHARSSKGGRPVADKRQMLRAIFWIRDNGAKWKDLPRECGSKSTAHRWFQKWTHDGVFEAIMRDAGRCVEEQDGYRLYECFIDGTFAKAKGGGDGIGWKRREKHDSGRRPRPAGGGGHDVGPAAREPTRAATLAVHADSSQAAANHR